MIDLSQGAVMESALALCLRAFHIAARQAESVHGALSVNKSDTSTH